MHTRRTFALTVAGAFLSVELFAQGKSDADLRGFVDSIYKLLDDKKYAEIYAHFHSSMKAQSTEQKWVATATDVGQRTGKNLERKFKEKQGSWGQQIFRFDSRYEGGMATDEIYVMEENGKLTVSGIWVKPTM